MAVTPNDLIFPQGELQAIFFPNKDMATAVSAWLNEAVAKVANHPNNQDEAIKAWVYYRAYQAVALRILGSPATEAYFNQVSRSYKPVQYEYFMQLASEKLQLYRDFTGETNLEIGPNPADAVGGEPGEWDFLIESEHKGFSFF